MVDLFEVFSEFSYPGIFMVLVAFNAAPLLVPPTWIILASFYAIDPVLDPLTLALVGATGATMGRMILKWSSGFIRRFVGSEQKTNLDAISGFLNSRRYGYALASFLFAATPLPSNMLFVTYGLMKAGGIALYAGFWLGRVISYYTMISISEVVLEPFLEIFEDRLIGVLVVDLAGICMVFLFASIDWGVLITRRRLRFVRPRLWRF